MVPLKERNAVPLSLDHCHLLKSYWQPLCLKYDLHFAEFSFMNNYLFRKHHNFFVLQGDPPLLRGQSKIDGRYYIIPPFGPENLKEIITLAIESKYDLFPIPDEWVSFFKNLNICIKWDRKDSDYLFTKEKLSSLSGRKLSSRRNLISQFENARQIETKFLSDSTTKDAINVLNEWQSNNEVQKSETDYEACLEALTNFSKLDLCGRIVYADKQPVGFNVGELLTPTTALLQISKSLHSEKGVTPYMHRDFAKNVPETVVWINLEQDLGLPSLRKAKEAYQPDQLLTKWSLCLEQL